MSMIPIATLNGTGSSASVTFSNIPQTFTHLQIKANVFTTASNYGLSLTFNGDTGSNYTYHRLSGDGSGTYSSAATSQTYSQFWGISQGTDTTYPTNFILDILDYTNTNKNKTNRILIGKDSNGSGEVGLYSGLWLSTNAITSITISSGINFATTSRFDLYGITNSPATGA